MAVALGVRAVAAIPVIMGGRPIGVVAVHRLQPPLFTPEQVANLWLLAAVVVAPLLELARLQRRVSEQEAHLQGVGLVCAANQPCPAHRREREVVPLLAAGRTNREIGAALHISPGSVRNVVRRLLAKLGARDRIRAVVLAGGEIVLALSREARPDGDRVAIAVSGWHRGSRTARRLSTMSSHRAER